MTAAHHNFASADTAPWHTLPEEGPEGEEGHASTIAAAGRVISGAGL